MNRPFRRLISSPGAPSLSLSSGPDSARKVEVARASLEGSEGRRENDSASVVGTTNGVATAWLDQAPESCLAVNERRRDDHTPARDAVCLDLDADLDELLALLDDAERSAR